MLIFVLSGARTVHLPANSMHSPQLLQLLEASILSNSRQASFLNTAAPVLLLRLKVSLLTSTVGTDLTTFQAVLLLEDLQAMVVNKAVSMVRALATKGMDRCRGMLEDSVVANLNLLGAGLVKLLNKVMAMGFRAATRDKVALLFVC